MLRRARPSAPRRPVRVLLAALAALGAALAATAPTAGQAPIPSPIAFFGFRMGAEGRLAGYDRIVEYFRLVDRLSDRVVVQDLGPTIEGRPYIVAIVSAPGTIDDLPRYREMQHRLADPRRTSAAEAERIAREGKVVVLIGANVHATEIGSSQMANELLYDLAAGGDPWVSHVLRDTIVLLVPSQNPDGQQMLVDWHDRHVGTPFEDAPLPELYHRYAGHDNNRDSYMLTQPETRYLARLTYREWLPEVYLDQHQMGSGRARIFVPPFKNPPNPNVDPLVWSQVNMLGQAMAARLQSAGKTGIMWGEVYSGFWQGANSTNPWWHNMVSLLTEVASAGLSRAVYQPPVSADGPFGSGGGRQPGDQQVPPTTDLQFRMNYPDPWRGGRWTPADVVEHHRLAAIGLLETVAAQRATLKRNFYLMNRRSIDRFSGGAPYAFLVPPSQHDPGAAAQLLSLLQGGGAEVHRAVAPFTADGVEYPAGTGVVLLAQPFGRWVKDLLEPQRYPDIRWPSPSAPIERPYDMTAWTLGMLMGVRTVQVEAPFTARLALLPTDTPPPAGTLRGNGSTFVIPHEPNASITVTHDLLARGADVAWTTAPVRLAGNDVRPGAIVVRRVPARTIAAMAAEHGLDVFAATTAPAADTLLPLTLPRVALYEPWGGAIDAGWTRWAFEQHRLPYTRVRHTDVLDDGFAERFDVLVLPDIPSAILLRGLSGATIRPEHRGGLGDAGIARLRGFVDAGGTLVTLGNASQFAIDQLGLPVVNRLEDADPEAFFCPGSLLRVDIDTGHPIGFGMPATAAAMFVNNGGYEPAARGGAAVTVVGHYPDAPLLMSGWLVGENRLRGKGAVLDVAVGRGRVIMHTFRVQNRGQTRGTFKLLFNSILYGPAASRRPAASQTQQF